MTTRPAAPPAWSGRMIASDGEFAGAPLLRGRLRLDAGHGPVTAATLYVSALGLVEAYVAGSAVSDEVLTPGWTSFEWRLRYRTHDVTAAVSAAGREVVVGLALGRGWAVGRLGWNGRSQFYADEPAAIADVVIDFADGHRQVWGTDESWRAGPSAVLANDLYDGETIDARQMSARWLDPDDPAEGWSAVHTVEFDTKRLVPYTSPVVRRQEVLEPQAIWASPSGRTLVDFGQNLVGWVRMRAQGTAGDVITVRHAEVLENGELGTRPLRSAAATDQFVLSGSNDVFEPTMTFHGFRYVEVDGYPGKLEAGDLEAVVVHTDFARIGRFESSDERVNQLHRNAVWGLKGNLVDVPTDCPQRDERLGWTGDVAVIGPTAAFAFDVAAMFDDWMEDLAAEMSASAGRVPYVVPDVLKMDEVPSEFTPLESTAVWSDVAAWLPWALWQAYGDAAMLARHLPSMVSHVRHVETLLSPEGLWNSGFQFGDWLDPDAPPDAADAAKADKSVVATACIYRSIVMTEGAARVVGDHAVADEMSHLGTRVRTAFQNEYVEADGTVRSDCQTVYALAICFDLLDEPQRLRAGERLASLVHDAAYRISAGFAGTPFILDALTATGHVEAAYQMLLQPEVPGWMYQVRMGATTMWERWDSMLPDGSINPGEMTSFNHYAFGSVADWMLRVVLGLAPDAPGYSRVLVAPRPGGGLTWASGSLQTRHGLVEVAWKLGEDDALTVDVATPPGVTTVVRLPGNEDVHLPPGDGTVTRTLASADA